MKLYTKLKLAGLATILSVSTSSAQTFGAAADYSLFITNGDGKLDAKDFNISGNVGISHGAEGKVKDASLIGKVDVYGSTSNFEIENTPGVYLIDSSSAINTSLNDANSDLEDLVDYYNGLAANSYVSGDTASGTSTKLNKVDLTLTSTQAVNVFDFKEIKFDKNTISLNSRTGYNDLFVIRIEDKLASSLTLMSGVDPSQVVWLINDGDATANHGDPILGGYSFEGTIINLEGKVTIGGEGQFSGQVYAKEIKLGSDGSFVTVVTVPEPSSTALLGLGALGLLIRRKR